MTGLAARARALLPRDRGEALAFARFLAAFSLLNAVVNLRYPGLEPALWYFLPASDIVILCGAFALVGYQGWRVRPIALGALTAWLLLVRVLRFGDGVQEAYYSQNFTLVTDLALAPELVRFARSTLPAATFWPLVLFAVALFFALPFACYRALRRCASYLADPRRMFLPTLCAAAAFPVGLTLRPHPDHGRLVVGGFGSSAIPRFRHELSLLANYYTERSERTSAIGRTERALAALPSNLEKLGGVNVLLILVESYGETLFERPEFAGTFAATVDEMTVELSSRGYRIATGRMESTTYGGRSWLAHATLGTGVRVADQLQYDLVTATAPKSMASYFRDAGYRTVLVHPGTTRPWPKGEFYRFEQRYYSWHFDYVGPPFAWATMPDQYVLDFIHRREVSKRAERLFVQYVLVTSHAPWTEVPSVVEDWATIGNGKLFDTLPVFRFPVTWPEFENGTEAYLKAVEYDFSVIRRYLADIVRDDSLVIAMGDHQPVAEVNGHSPSRIVPVHVFSRREALIRPFLARGYRPGLRPARNQPVQKMESFLGDFLKDFSLGSR